VIGESCEAPARSSRHVTAGCDQLPVPGEIFLLAFVTLVHRLMSEMNSAARMKARLRLASCKERVREIALSNRQLGVNIN